MFLCGDGPLILTGTLITLIKTHESAKSALTLATALLEDPSGYGRIVRDENGIISEIVEHNDCT
ncbi:bifunctional UDP-N-acetylglucosamine diphosphorylase/glucosamine-1-phosphate N-acetyltransferase GlmU, partial [Planctomycetota bacterium]